MSGIAEPSGPRRGIAFLCVVCTSIILVAGLWPFNFRNRNDVTWLDGKDGIHFGRLGIACVTGSVYGPRQAIRPGGPISIELVARPKGNRNSWFSAILTIYNKQNSVITLAQRRSHLVLIALSHENRNRRFHKLDVSNVFSKNVSRTITVTSRKGLTVIYVDGKRMTPTGNFTILPEDRGDSGTLVLGSHPSGGSPWTGDLLFLAIYDRELSADEVARHFERGIPIGPPKQRSGSPPPFLYRFNERTGFTSRNDNGDQYIAIPRIYPILQKAVLRPPWHEGQFDREFFRDVAVNILGFLPVGFLFAVWVRKDYDLPTNRDTVVVAALGGCISLGIELAQVYLPSRTSSLSDLICNVSGTILGVYLLRWIMILLDPAKSSYKR